MTQATLARPDAPHRQLRNVVTIVLVVVAALLCFALNRALADPARVAHVTVVNPSSIPIEVDVRGAPDGDRLVLGAVPAGGDATTADVIDQGERWTFAVSSGGVDGGTVTLSRHALESQGWRFVVPDSAIERIRDGQFVPAYR